MAVYFKKEFIVYRQDVVRRHCENIMMLAAEAETREQFESESLTYVNNLFSHINLEANEYYAILKYRAQILETVAWVNG